jgi:hypothetical protein
MKIYFSSEKDSSDNLRATEEAPGNQSPEVKK